MKHLNFMVSNLSNGNILKACGFVVMAEQYDHDMVYHIDLEFAKLLGTSTAVHIGIRHRRGLFYMGGWPHSAPAMLHKDNKVRDAATQRFRRDKINHEALMALENPGRITQLMQKHSQFKTVAVQLISKAMAENQVQSHTQGGSMLGSKRIWPLANKVQ